MTLSLMIKKKYLREKVREQEHTGSFHERREYKRFWRSRIGSTSAWRLGGDAVFLCGRHSFAAGVRNIKIADTPDAYTVVAGQVCYDIECKFGDVALRDAILLTDEARKEVHDLIKHDFCTIFQREYKNE